MLLNEQQIKEIEEKLEYVFKDKQLLVTAFTHSSYVNEHPATDNQILEFYGNYLLDLILVETILEKLPLQRYDEGILSNVLTYLKNNEYLNDRMKMTDLERYLIKGNCAQVSQTKGLADLFESLIAAIYIDSGKNITETSGVAGRLLAPEAVLSTVTSASYTEQMKHPKNRLQEWCQKQGFGIPIYEKIENGGIKLSAAGNEVTAWGRNIDSAEKKAAEKLLSILENSTSRILSEEPDEFVPSVDLSDETTEISKIMETRYDILKYVTLFITEPHPISWLNLVKQKFDPNGKYGMYVTYDQKLHHLYRATNLNHFIYKCSVGLRNLPDFPEIITYGEGNNSSDAKYNSAKKMVNIIKQITKVSNYAFDTDSEYDADLE